MCGRFALMYDSWEVAEQIQRGFNLEINSSASGSSGPSRSSHNDEAQNTGEESPYFRASFNISPTNVAAVYKTQEKSEIKYMKWGLVPSWTKDISKFKSYSTFNARAETLQQSRLWVHPLKSKRCAIPVSGYYEWKTTGDKKGKKSQLTKTPFYVTRSDAKLIFLAGMYDYVPSEDYYSFTIITGIAPKNLEWLHSRMPVVIEPGTKEWDTWMNPDKEKWEDSELKDVLGTNFNEEYMICYQVSPDVGKTTNNGEKLIKPILKSDKNKFEGIIKDELQDTSIHISLKDQNGFFNTKKDDVKIEPKFKKEDNESKNNTVEIKNENSYVKKEHKDEDKEIKAEDADTTPEESAGNTKNSENSPSKGKRNIMDMLRSSSKPQNKKRKP
ncbi:Uncharacterized protein RNJ44_04451 [Nakaseomyces bracarensis]|uniref:DUF159-domain-containing protein n=1 Tax=Nakaseomyces bracarensis TaxID=273131 RepID=A0ABR4NV00_9SACH